MFSLLPRGQKHTQLFLFHRCLIIFSTSVEETWAVLSCHRHLSGFLAKNPLPRASRRSCLSVNDRERSLATIAFAPECEDMETSRRPDLRQNVPKPQFRSQYCIVMRTLPTPKRDHISPMTVRKPWFACLPLIAFTWFPWKQAKYITQTESNNNNRSMDPGGSMPHSQEHDS